MDMRHFCVPSVKSRNIVTIATICWLLAGCTNLYSTIANSAKYIDAQEGLYEGAAWLDGNQIAFLFRPSEPSNLWDRQIMIYSLTSKEWHILDVPQPDKCISLWAQILSRLPNGKLGFIFVCNVIRTHRESDTLYIWDDKLNTLQAAQSYPDGFPATRFAFSPDMSNLIQEEAVGAGLENQLQQVNINGDIQRLFPTYQRVGSPAWSPDGSIVAFLGTNLYSPGTPRTGDDLANLYSYPSIPSPIRR
jgi:hypothetical protein